MIKNFFNLLLFMGVMLALMFSGGILSTLFLNGVTSALGGKGIAFCYAAVLFACWWSVRPKRSRK
jgi:hypothetical protein